MCCFVSLVSYGSIIHTLSKFSDSVVKPLVKSDILVKLFSWRWSSWGGLFFCTPGLLPCCSPGNPLCPYPEYSHPFLFEIYRFWMDFINCSLLEAFLECNKKSMKFYYLHHYYLCAKYSMFGADTDGWMERCHFL